MITLTEKRLRELEAHIPVYMAQIAEQQKRIEEIFSFPKDLQEIRALCKRLADGMSDQADTSTRYRVQLESKEYSLEQLVQSQKEQLASHAARFTDSEKTIIDLKSKLASYEQVRDLHEALLHRYSIELATLNKCVSDQNAKIADLNQVLIDMQVRINSIDGKASGMSSDVVRHEDGFKAIADSLRSFQSDTIANIGRSHQDILGKLQKAIDEIKSEIPSKDHSEEVQQLKNELDVLRLAIQASQGKDTSSIEAKIKVMENAIASIYSILKKFENR